MDAETQTPDNATNSSSFLLNKKTLLLFIVPVFFITLIIVLVIKNSSSFSSKTVYKNNSYHSRPTPTPVMGFKVLRTTPINGQTNVYAGEQAVSFTTLNSIPSASEFSLFFQPELSYKPVYSNKYPTKTVVADILGGLAPNTKYTVSILDTSGKYIYSWSFTTGSKPTNTSSSGLEAVKEKQDIQQNYPLFNYIPYQSNDYYIDYTGPLTLDVNYYIPNLNQVKQEVNDWIKSHGVDPSTHTINYVADY